MNNNELIRKVMEESAGDFAIIDEISLKNQRRVQNAFKNNKVALMHFNQTNGYGYDDVGRDTLAKVVAGVFETEKAIAGPLIASGTHAITTALFGVLRPGNVVLSVSDKPYDTLHEVIYGENIGSLKDFGIRFESISLVNNDFDYDKINELLSTKRYQMVYVQRSRGYSSRNALSVEQIGKLANFVHKISDDICVFCDNCYGEFVDVHEPTALGVDLCAGSFIKNIGGGIAPTGGYIAGKTKYVDLCAGRLTVPSIGSEIGSYTGGYRLFYQGLYNAPHAVNQALKSVVLFVRCLNELGYKTLPKPDERLNDIVCSIELKSAEKLVSFCQSIQAVSPVDSHVVPMPWDMPGYNDQVIMAAGCFVQGASLELSCDGPLREPYIAYLQGGTTIEQILLALESVVNSLNKNS